jgi:hypothetical protein
MQDVEVYGSFEAREILLQKAVQVAKEKINQYPVIFFCKDDQECANIAQNFDSYDIFGEETEVAVQLSILQDILACEQDKVVLTTRKASIGMDILFKAMRAFTISTEESSTMDELF